MKKRLIISAIFISLLLTGCSGNNKDTQKPKIKAPYSALIKDKSSLQDTNSSKPQDNVVSEPIETNETSIFSSTVSETQVILKTQASPITDFEYKTNDFVYDRG